MPGRITPRPIVIDTDPGIDDAVAILLALAAPELATWGLVAVAGNLPLAITSRNARAVLELAGRAEIPVYAGCPRPLAPHRGAAPHVHGEGGLGTLILAEPATPCRPEHGVGWLIETLRTAGPGSMTLCALGPLTNIATALVMAPEIAAAIGELVIMGGGTRGNMTPAAEFNIYCDPQAAAIVFDSGVPITLVPLDVTETTAATADRFAAIAALRTRCAAAVATMLGHRDGGEAKSALSALHDPCVIAWLIAPHLFRSVEASVAVETGSALTMGMTVIDRRGRSGRPPNVRLLVSIDAEGFYRLLAERLATLP